MNKLATALLSGVLLGILVVTQVQAATFVINNNDQPGEGFNDPTPVNPTGNNPGTTLGAQRLNAFQFAADQLGARLKSNVPIVVDAKFVLAQSGCAPGNATLGSTGATLLVSDFHNAPRSDTFYPIALANALAGRDLDDAADIGGAFNGDIDNNNQCLSGVSWYYGFDDNPPGKDINFIATAVHELIHGLGFASFAELSTGKFSDGTPDIYSVFIRDLTQGATWPNLTAPQRAASVVNDGNVVWDGPSAISNGAPTLSDGTNQGRIQLFAPNPQQPGSSISHWDTAVSPDALMEPFETGNMFITQAGIGLASCVLQDIGWTLINNTRCPDGVPISEPSDPGDMGEGENPPPDTDDGDGILSGGGGGGGCTLGGGPADPLLPLLVLLSLLVLYRRRA